MFFTWFPVSWIDAPEAENLSFYVKNVFFTCFPVSCIDVPLAENMSFYPGLTLRRLKADHVYVNIVFLTCFPVSWIDVPEAENIISLCVRCVTNWKHCFTEGHWLFFDDIPKAPITVNLLNKLLFIKCSIGFGDVPGIPMIANFLN